MCDVSRPLQVSAHHHLDVDVEEVLEYELHCVVDCLVRLILPHLEKEHLGVVCQVHAELQAFILGFDRYHLFLPEARELRKHLKV